MGKGWLPVRLKRAVTTVFLAFFYSPYYVFLRLENVVLKWRLRGKQQ
jgi:hypothetical protein